MASFWCLLSGVSNLTSFTAQKIKFFMKDFFGKYYQNPQETLTGEILSGKLNFLCSE